MAMPSEIPPPIDIRLRNCREHVTVRSKWTHMQRLRDIVRWYAAMRGVDENAARRAVVTAMLEVGVEMLEKRIWPTDEELWERVGNMAKNAYTGERDPRTAMAEDDPRQAYIRRSKLRRVK